MPGEWNVCAVYERPRVIARSPARGRSWAILGTCSRDRLGLVCIGRLGRVAKRLDLGLYAPTAQSPFFWGGTAGEGAVYVCYIDESGTSDIPGNTSHFVLAGISVPIDCWHDTDRQVSSILQKYGLENSELHTAWLLRSYLEQRKVPNFDKLDWPSRRFVVEKARDAHLLKLQRSRNLKSYRQTKKNYQNSNAYIHLTFAERKALVREVADCVSGWSFARMFAECINKLHFDPAKTGRTIDAQSFEQVVSRFERYIHNCDPGKYGLLVHDNNETVARKHTTLMRHFHSQGTLWTKISHIIETPLFVDSKLTRMVQIADLCAYALRRYVENNELDLFRPIFSRADRANGITVGVRHYTDMNCNCKICSAHRLIPW